MYLSSTDHCTILQFQALFLTHTVLLPIILVKSTIVQSKVGSILDFSFDIDTNTGQKTSDSISIFSISVE